MPSIVERLDLAEFVCVGTNAMDWKLSEGSAACWLTSDLKNHAGDLDTLTFFFL